MKNDSLKKPMNWGIHEDVIWKQYFAFYIFIYSLKVLHVNAMNFDNIHIHLPECNSNQDHNHISLPTPGPAFLLIGLFVYFFICLFLIQLVLSLCVHQYGGHTQVYGEPISSHMPTEKNVFLPPAVNQLTFFPQIEAGALKSLSHPYCNFEFSWSFIGLL